MSLPKSLRQKREASREQAFCSCGEPIWPCARAGAFDRPLTAVSAIVARKNSLRDIGGSNLTGEFQVLSELVAMPLVPSAEPVPPRYSRFPRRCYNGAKD